MTAPDLRDVLRRAHHSMTAAITAVETDQEAAMDDLIAARLLIATALLAIQQGTGLLG